MSDNNAEKAKTAKTKTTKAAKTKAPAKHPRVNLNKVPPPVIYPNAAKTISEGINHVYGSQSNLSRILGISRQTLWQRIATSDHSDSAHQWWSAVLLLSDEAFSELAGENSQKLSVNKEIGYTDLPVTAQLFLRAFIAELTGSAGKWEHAARNVRHSQYIEKLRDRAKTARDSRINTLGT